MAESDGRHFKQAGAAGSSQSSGDVGFDVQPIATAPHAPEPVQTGAHASHAKSGMRFKQPVASSGQVAGAAPQPASPQASAGRRFAQSQQPAGQVQGSAAARASSAAGSQAGASNYGTSPSETMQFMRAYDRQRAQQSKAEQAQRAQTAGTAGYGSQAQGAAQQSQGATAAQQSGAAQGFSGSHAASTQQSGGYQRATVQPVQPYQAASSAQSAYQQPEEPPRKRRNILSTALIVVGIVLIVVAAGIMGKALLGYHEAATVYDDLEQYALTDDDGTDVPSVDFEALAAINADIVGWIYIPGTQINYPVVQTDDNSTYLSKLFDDSSNTCGTIFMDYEDTAPGLVDQQTTLYGHHMNDGSMFKFIDNTLDQDDFDTVEVVYYITADAVYVLKPLCTTEVDETYLDARETNFGTTAMFQEYVAEMVSQASAVADDAEERISSTEQVLTLVTCAGEVLPRTTRAAMLCTIEEIISTTE